MSSMHSLTKKSLFVSLLFSISYALVFSLLSGRVITFAWVCVGLVLGYGILHFDEQWLFKRYIDREKPQGGGLITRSLLFLMAFLALSIFIITSSASMIGLGLVTSIGTVLGYELWLVRDSREQFTQIFTPLHPDHLTDQHRQQGIAVFITVLSLLLLWAL